MAVTFHHFVSFYSFIMGVLWFNAFVLLGLLIRKLRFPIKYSAVPLLLLLALSIFRMFIAIEVPGTLIILSETIYPAIIIFIRYEIISSRIFGIPINIANVLLCVWVIGAVWLITRYVYEYIGNFRPVMKWLGSYPRDEYAESLLAEIIGSDKNFRVYRNKAFNTAVTTAFKPYIILPEINFSPDELRVILLHEWKHIQDKDYLTGIIVNIISFVFWWNPMVYVLRRNFRFAQELKSDQFAVSDERDFDHYLDGILSITNLEKEKSAEYSKYVEANSFINGDDGLPDRLKILALRRDSRKKLVLANIAYFIIIFALFVASYMFIVLPAFWESPDVPVSAEDFTEEYRNGGGTFRTEDVFLIDNGDGTFSFYVDGQFTMYLDDSHDIFHVLPILTRDED